MTTAQLYLITGAGLYCIGLYGLLACQHLLRVIMAFNIMGAGVFMVLISSAARTMSGDPDPLPHAMVLTGIVVAVSASALAVILAARLHRLTGKTRLTDTEDRD